MVCKGFLGVSAVSAHSADGRLEWSHSVLTSNVWEGTCFNSHFTDEKVEVQSGSIICWSSFRSSGGESGIDPPSHPQLVHALEHHTVGMMGIPAAGWRVAPVQVVTGDRKEPSLGGCPLHAEHRARLLIHYLILCPEQMLMHWSASEHCQNGLWKLK